MRFELSANIWWKPDRPTCCHLMRKLFDPARRLSNPDDYVRADGRCPGCRTQVTEVSLFEQTADPFGTDISSCNPVDFSGIRELKKEIRIDPALRR